jgi:hypothetical protein
MANFTWLPLTLIGERNVTYRLFDIFTPIRENNLIFSSRGWSE